MATRKKQSQTRTGLLHGPSRKQQPWQNVLDQAQEQITIPKQYIPITDTLFIIGNNTNTFYTVPSNKQARIVFAMISFTPSSATDRCELLKNQTIGTEFFRVHRAGVVSQTWRYEEAPVFTQGNTIDCNITSSAGVSTAYITIHIIEEFTSTGFYKEN